MEQVKLTVEECEDDPPSDTSEEVQGTLKTRVKKDEQFFQCEICGLYERYEYFGNEPSFLKHFKLLENAYLIEDPFVPQKQGEFIILGAHCIKCGKTVCKESNCSIYYEGTFCIHCAKDYSKTFPQTIQVKLNKIITS